MSSPTIAMDTYLAIVSLRAIRKYASDPLPDDILQRILQAGRATGSSRNRQPWLFYVVSNRDVLSQLAGTVSSPGNIAGCQVAIALVLTSKNTFDGGRAAQNMMLAAWAHGVGSCPNRPRNPEEVQRLLGITDEVTIPTILSMGYPAELVGPRDTDPDAILGRINRKPLEQLVRFIR